VPRRDGGGKPHVQSIGHHGFNLMHRHQMMEHELDVRLPAPEFAKRVHNQPMPGHRRRDADSKRARLAESNPFGAAPRVVDVLQNASRIAQEHLSCFAQSHSARQFAQDRMVLAVPKGHPLTKRERIRLRDLRDLPFIWFYRWVNPAFYDRMMEACARGGLSAPHIVQEATDRDTVLGLVQCRIGIAWVTESTRWHCPRAVVLLPVVDMNVRLPFNVIWKKDNASPLLQKFLAQVQASQQ
jgi:hypothetical protein